MHVLLVHAVVILMPLCAVLLVLSTVWPAARRRFAAPNALLGISLLGLVPVTASAGEWLQGRVGSDALVRRHADLGGTAIWFAFPLAALSVLVWWRHREITAASGELEAARGPAPLARLLTHERALLAPASRGMAAALAVAAVVAGTAATYDIYRIGDSGAKAAWHDSFNASSH